MVKEPPLPLQGPCVYDLHFCPLPQGRFSFFFSFELIYAKYSHEKSANRSGLYLFELKLEAFPF